MRPILLLLWLICALAPSDALPQTREPPAGASPPGIEVRRYLFEPTGEQLEYYIHVPDNVRKNKASPLVIVLHGLGVPPQAMLGAVSAAADRHGYILAAPMGYNLKGWYGFLGPAYASNAELSRIAALSEQDVMNVLERVRAEFSIDDSRIYILGDSMGGGGALYLGMKYPERWAAIAAAAPAVYDGIPAMIEGLRTVPTFMIHGDADAAVPVEWVRRWVQRMKELGLPFQYREIPGGSHGAPLRSGLEDFFRFFDQNRKAAQPRAEGRANP